MTCSICNSTMECHGVPWSAMECHGVPWSAMECHGVPWSAMECHGVPWSWSGLVHRICVLMAKSSECGFESLLRPWWLCPRARHFTIIASLHPGVNGYLWGQSWLLCLIYAPKRQHLSCILPRELRWFQEWFMRLMSRGNNVQCFNLVARICLLLLLDKFGWTKKKWLERDLNLRPPDWRAGALPTELSSPTLAVSLFCQYLCLGDASQTGFKSRSSQFFFDHPHLCKNVLSQFPLWFIAWCYYYYYIISAYVILLSVLSFCVRLTFVRNRFRLLSWGY